MSLTHTFIKEKKKPETSMYNTPFDKYILSDSGYKLMGYGGYDPRNLFQNYSVLNFKYSVSHRREFLIMGYNNKCLT